MSIFKDVAELLKSGENIVLATVLSRLGSAPRTSGARMVVKRDGNILGTVGGGKIEAMVREMAADLLMSRKSAFKDFVLASEEAGGMGMICGGRVEVLLHYLDPGAGASCAYYQAIAQALDEQKKVEVVTLARAPDKPFDRVHQWLLMSDGAVVCNSERSFPDIGQILVRPHEDSRYVLYAGEKFHVETLFNSGTAFIFGCGHVGQAMAVLTSFTGFRTVVLDDRVEFANRERFGGADEVVVLESFENATGGLNIGPDSYIVILTRGHMHDQIVLAQALRTRAGYIGMIGSRVKRDAVFKALLEEGFTKEDLERVHAPVGLAIGAETPEEIAVSIAAELIQARAKKSGNGRKIGCKERKSLL